MGDERPSERGVYRDLVAGVRALLAAGAPGGGVAASEARGSGIERPDAERPDVDGSDTAGPHAATLREHVRRALTLGPVAPEPRSPRVERSWRSGGLRGQELSWSVGYGPRTRAWLLVPDDASGPLPGVLALHDHGAFKSLGKEKVADDDRPPIGVIDRHRQRAYGGAAFANRLARRGFAVLVPDALLWSSRRVPLSAMPERVRDAARWGAAGYRDRGFSPARARYEAAAEQHEHVVEKTLRALGTSLAAAVAYEDRVALRCLASRPEVDGERVGAVGLSGGGARAALLSATAAELAASVVVGMMSTYDGLLPDTIAPHTWMLFPPGLAPRGDWPDVAACQAPRPLLVQYLEGDALFPLRGMRAAHRAIGRRFEELGAAAAYQGQFVAGPHRFDRAMQDAAFAFLERALRS